MCSRTVTVLPLPEGGIFFYLVDGIILELHHGERSPTIVQHA